MEVHTLSDHVCLVITQLNGAHAHTHIPSYFWGEKLQAAQVSHFGLHLLRNLNLEKSNLLHGSPHSWGVILCSWVAVSTFQHAKKTLTSPMGNLQHICFCRRFWKALWGAPLVHTQGTYQAHWASPLLHINWEGPHNSVAVIKHDCFSWGILLAFWKRSIFNCQRFEKNNFYPKNSCRFVLGSYD